MKFANIKNPFEIDSLRGRRLCVDWIEETPYGRIFWSGGRAA
jgi:hypothetical protein